MSQVSLNSSMRTTLLALQETQQLQDVFTMRLSTGLKVNSPLDNPSSYYTASSLDNRSKDLNTLLDSVSQSIQTIKTAQDAIDHGITLLEQAQQLTSEAISLNNEYTEYTRVSTVEELKQAIEDTTSKNILITKSLTFKTDEFLEVADGKNITAIDEDITLNFTMTKDGGTDLANSKITSVLMGNNSTLANVTVNLNRVSGTGYISAIKAQDVNMTIDNLTIRTTGDGAYGLLANNSTVTGDVNIKTTGDWARGIYAYDHSEIIGNFDIMTSGYGSYGVIAHMHSVLDGNVNVLTQGVRAHGVHINIGSSIAANSIINSVAQNDRALELERGTVEKGVELYLSYWNEAPMVGYVTTSNYTHSGKNFTPAGNIPLSGETKSTQDFTNWMTSEVITPPEMAEEEEAENPYKEYEARFLEIAEQYDMLIGDASYKSINLLAQSNLTTYFNEDRSSSLKVNGVDASSQGLGLEKNLWLNLADVKNSLSQIENAIKQLKSFDSDFGNSFSIATTQNNFLESFINVLSEGADKLTLADMNEEAANMLASQTRQSLATNALSLAAQSSQNVLTVL